MAGLRIKLCHCKIWWLKIRHRIYHTKFTTKYWIIIIHIIWSQFGFEVSTTEYRPSTRWGGWFFFLFFLLLPPRKLLRTLSFKKFHKRAHLYTDTRSRQTARRDTARPMSKYNLICHRASGVQIWHVIYITILCDIYIS